MRRNLRTPAWLGLVLTLAVVAAACGGDDEGDGGAEPTGAATGGEYSVQICEPQFLTPMNSNETCGSQVLKGLFTPLVTFDENDELVYAVAESLESEDNVTWTVKIRDGWTFHDGTPVTAQSFVDAWNWGAYGPNAAQNNYFYGPSGINIVGYDELNPEEGKPSTKEMEGLKVVDDLTFTVELGAPFSELPITLSYNAFYPVPQSFLDDPKAANEAPVGNGPYMMDGQWEHDVGINVVRYEDYAGTPGNADAIEFRIYADPDTAYRDVQAGNLDYTDVVPTDQLASAPTEFGDRFVEAPSSYFGYIGFPLWAEPFDNPDIRKALSMAIDREEIVEKIYLGTYLPADDFANPTVQGYREGVCTYCVYDPEQAKQLFDAAVGIDGEVTFWFNNDGGHEEWVEAVANMWRNTLGIEANFESIPFAKYLTVLDEGIDNEPGDTDGVTGPFRLAWVMDYPSMQNYIENLNGTGAGSNYTTYANPEFDDLIAQGKAASSPEEAISFYQQADDMLAEDMPIAPTWFGVTHGVYSERITNVNVDKFSFLDVAAVQVVG